MIIGTLKNNRVASYKSIPNSDYELKFNEVVIPNKNYLGMLYNKTTGQFESDAKHEEIKTVNEQTKAINNKSVSPVMFKMLLTSEERKFIRTKRNTDDTIDDFWEILEDIRLKEVDLLNDQVIDLIYYVGSVFVGNNIYTQDQADERVRQILNAESPVVPDPV